MGHDPTFTKTWGGIEDHKTMDETAIAKYHTVNTDFCRGRNH